MERSTKAGKSWHVAVGKPAGGYVPIPADNLLRAWRAYQEGVIGLFDLRVWLACHELVARRCSMDRKLKACYRLEELRPLLGGGTSARLRKTVRSLEAAGLLDWQGDSIGLVPSACEDESLDAMRDAVQNWRRKVPVPRRVVRFLAGCGRKVIIATVLGHLLRCVYWRDGGCISGGRCKASWIADVFGVDLRNVKAARKELVDLGWLMPLDTSQTSLNRWGLPVVVNLDLVLADGRACRESPPPGQLSTAKSPPPYMNKELPSGSKNQQLGRGRIAGLAVKKEREREPDLRSVTVADLMEPRRLDRLFRQAVAIGAAADSPAERLRWFAAAERALNLGTLNPCGFFMRLFRQSLWHYITNAQEDAARVKLQRLDNEQAAPCPGAACGSVRINFDKSGRLAIQIQPTAAMIADAPAKSIAA
jgi:hypothetical protein